MRNRIVDGVMAFGLVWAMVLVVFFCGCSRPLLNLGAQNSGFLLAQEKPDLAREMLGISQDVLDAGIENFTEPAFEAWAEMMVEKLGLDPFLQMNFKEMLRLVDIEIELSESDRDTVELLYRAVANFVIGIEANR